MIKFDLKNKSFDGKTILENIQLQINAGDRLHLIAPSGTGKTTLMRILMMIDVDFEGTIENEFKKMSATYPERVFMGGISIYKEIKTFTHRTEAEIDAALKALKIYDAKHKRAKELSTGMRSRASIIRSMITDAEIVFLDEPLLGLDENTKKLAIDFIKTHSQNKTIIYTGDTIYTDETTYELKHV